MRNTRAQRCLAIRPDAFAYLGKRLMPPVARQVVARVVKGKTTSRRIERAIEHFLRFHKYPLPKA